VALAGRVFTHEVGDWGSSDSRTCIARWIRKGVFKQHGVEELPWASVDNVRARLGM
jgi:hypothetical protein